MNCPNCGNPEVNAATNSCDACGGALPAADMAPQSSGNKGWGADTQSMDCENCGAETVFSATEMVLECPYCGSQKVVQAPPGAADDVVTPDYVIPFSIEKQKSNELFHSWVGGLWFAPNDLKQRADAGSIRGVYLPFWVYDVKTQSYYAGQVGEDYQESYTETNAEGQTVQKSRTKTKWRHGSGWHNHEYDDVLVCASKGVERSLVEAIEPWNMKDRQAYSPQFLAGWEAERYKIDEEMAWKDRGRDRVYEMEKSACESKLRREYKADRVQGLTVDVRYSGLSSKHMLLPCYISAYSYQDKDYKFMINGQTGEVQGERPYSWIKIAIFVLVIVGIIALIVLLSGGKKDSSSGALPCPAPIHGVALPA
jgi:ribosomal protein S27E